MSVVKKAQKIFFVSLMTLLSGSQALAASGTIGITLPTQNDPNWYASGPKLVAELQKRGYSTVLYYGGDGDVSIQQAQIPRMVNEDHVDLMIIAPVKSNSLKEELKTAKKMQIPVIAFDNLIGDSDAVDYYVGFDNIAVGRMQAEYLINVLNLDSRSEDDPAYMELCAGDAEDLCARKSFEGFIETVKPYIEAKKLVIPSTESEYDSCSVQNAEADQAMKRMDLLASKLQYDPKAQRLDAVYCASDHIANGVLQSLRRKGYTAENMPYLTGKDGTDEVLDEIRDGAHRCTVYRDPEVLNNVAADLVDALLQGTNPEINDSSSYSNGSYSLKSVLSEPMLIEPANIMFYF